MSSRRYLLVAADVRPRGAPLLVTDERRLLRQREGVPGKVEGGGCGVCGDLNL